MYSRAACSRCRQLVWVSQDAGQEQAQCGRCRLSLDAQLSPTCGICLEALVDPVAYSRVDNESWTNEKCQHRFCRGCLRGHLRARLEEGAWNVRCPAVGCAYLWVEADVRKVTAPGAVPEAADRAADAAEGDRLLQRFRGLRSVEYGAHLRAILGQQDAAAPQSGDVGDPGPGTAAGEPGDCGDAGKASAEDLQQAPPQEFGAWARQSCQACPRCFVVVRKEIGCNHMRCRCGTSFCYGCGAPCDADGEDPHCICHGRPAEGPKLARWLRAEGKLP